MSKEPSAFTDAIPNQKSKKQPAGADNVRESDTKESIRELVAERDLAFAEFVAYKAESLVTQKSTRRENRRLALVSATALVLGLLGVSSVTGTVQATALKEVGNAELRANKLLAATEDRVTKHAEATAITATRDQLESIVADIQSRIRLLEVSVSSERKYVQWSNSIDRLADPDVKSFTNGERDAALSLLSALVTEADVEAPEFVSTLAAMCSAFAQADQAEQLYRIESIVPESVWRTRSAAGLCYTMLQFFGRLALSSASPERHLKVTRRFLAYARLHELQGEAYAYEALLEYSTGTRQRDDRIVRILQDAATLRSAEASRFVDRLDVYSDASRFTKVEDAQSGRLVQLLADFRLEYQAEIENVRASVPQEPK